jgi:predicted flap endonuclease-1-like 5' DNA nuclease
LHQTCFPEFLEISSFGTREKVPDDGVNRRENHPEYPGMGFFKYFKGPGILNSGSPNIFKHQNGITMLWFLGLFDPGWRDLSVRMSNTEITLLWILAALLGALLYHFFLGRRGKVSADWQAKYDHLLQELQDEKGRHHKMKQQLDAAQSKANSFAATAGELDKLKHKIHDLQRDLDQSKELAVKHKLAFDQEHARVTSMMVDHSEVESLRNRVRNQEKELQLDREEITRLKAALDLVQSEKVRLSASLDERQVSAMQDKINKLENDLHGSRLLVVKYQTEWKQMEEDQARLKAAQADADSHSGELAGLRQKTAQLEADLQKARQGLAEAAALRAELDSVKAERDKWTHEADVQARNASAAIELESRVSSLEGQLRILESDKRRIQSELDVALTEKATLAEALAKAAGPVKPDNLKVIEGIGPKLEEMLNQHRISTFRQLADTPVAVLQGILDEAGETYRIHDPGTWPEQAKLLSEGKLDAFEKLTEELKGGRRVE